MPTYKIYGAHAETGEDTYTVVTADSPKEAEAFASIRKVIVGRVVELEGGWSARQERRVAEAVSSLRRRWNAIAWASAWARAWPWLAVAVVALLLYVGSGWVSTESITSVASWRNAPVVEPNPFDRFDNVPPPPSGYTLDSRVLSDAEVMAMPNRSQFGGVPVDPNARTFTLDDLKKDTASVSIIPGDTREKVRGILGTPDKATTRNSGYVNQTEAWVYRRVTITFDYYGRVAGWEGDLKQAIRDAGYTVH